MSLPAEDLPPDQDDARGAFPAEVSLGEKHSGPPPVLRWRSEHRPVTFLDDLSVRRPQQEPNTQEKGPGSPGENRALCCQVPAWQSALRTHSSFSTFFFQSSLMGAAVSAASMAAPVKSTTAS